MTPAVALLKRKKIQFRIHEYCHDTAAESFGLEAAEKLGLPPARVFKTLVVLLSSGDLAVGIIPVSDKLSMKHIAKATGGKKAEMAQPALVERTTGYVLGGVSPLGQKKSLQTIIDESALNWQTIFVSAGKRGLEIELAPGDLKSMLNATFANITQSS